ncbi:MAG: hypothetical protein J6Q05_03470 [Elusimicrobiaceae bacterium]|nr:hypothetical protein [Elusimicrobiaceae bacterium]
MIKILIKALILICIILSIYFIVNPSACSNLMSGRVVNSMEKVPTFVPKDQDHSELLTPAGDQPVKMYEKPAKTTPVEQPVEVTPEESTAQADSVQTNQNVPSAVADTNSTQEAQQIAQTAEQSTYTQADADYAIAARYVELENEYIAKKKDTKNAAKEISYIVMDDFELTPSEWEAFLQRATASNLFDKVRAEQANKK